jgi:hypothetical protein
VATLWDPLLGAAGGAGGVVTPTPAPWTVTVWDQTVFIHGGPDNDDIADFSFADQHTVSISKDEAIANATLCAAAHDLLEACNALVTAYWQPRGYSASDLHAAAKTVRAAIAKATVKP